MTDSFLSLGILNQIHRGILVPQLRVRNLSEFEAQKLLVNIHSLLDNVLGWEVLFNLLFIDAVFLLLKDVGVKAPIPRLENSIRIPGFLPFKILKKF